jgi:hypothetical protein
MLAHLDVVQRSGGPAQILFGKEILMMNHALIDVIRALNLSVESTGAPAYQGQVKVTYRGRAVQLPYILITAQDLPHEQAAWEEFLVKGLLEQSLDIAGCFIDYLRGFPTRGPGWLWLEIQTKDAHGLLDVLHRQPYDDDRYEEFAFRVWSQAYGSTDHQQWLREYALEAGMHDLLGDELEALRGLLLAERPWLINDHPLLIPLVAVWQQQAEALIRQLFTQDNRNASS